MKIKNSFKKSGDITEGNGLKYIRSRLTESFDKNWELYYYGDESVWVTNINILSGTN